jgi:hypothetical protein
LERAVLLSANLSKVSIDTVVADLTAAARDISL